MTRKQSREAQHGYWVDQCRWFEKYVQKELERRILCQNEQVDHYVKHKFQGLVLPELLGKDKALLMLDSRGFTNKEKASHEDDEFGD